MKKVFVSLGMVAAFAMFSSCASTKNISAVSSLDGEWNIIEINDVVVVPVSGQEFPYIGFEITSGNVYGNSGCNSIIGSFDTAAKPGVLKMGPLGSTRIVCPDMTLEQNLLSVLAQVKKYKVLGEENMLLMTSSKRRSIVLQKRKAQAQLSDLDGTWLIREVEGVLVPEDMEKQPFVSFNIAEKHLHGQAGCNIVNGPLKTDDNDGSLLSFPPLMTTMMVCPDMEVEKLILKALNDTHSFGWLPETDCMGLYDTSGSLVMTLIKK